MVKIYELDSPSDDQYLESVTNLGHEKTKDIKGGTKFRIDLGNLPSIDLGDRRIIREGPPPIDDLIRILREGPPPPHDCILREGPPPPPFLEEIQSPKPGFHPGHRL